MERLMDDFPCGECLLVSGLGFVSVLADTVFAGEVAVELGVKGLQAMALSCELSMVVTGCIDYSSRSRSISCPA